MKYLVKYWLVMLSVSLHTVLCLEEDRYNTVTSQVRQSNECVYLCDNLFNIKNFIDAVSLVDLDETSPVHRLKEYISMGGFVGLYCDIIAVLECCNDIIQQQEITDYKKSLDQQYRNIMCAINHGKLSINRDMVKSFCPLLSFRRPAKAPCDTVVVCNINMLDSISPTVGNIMKGAFSFIHNTGTSNTFVGINAGNFFTSGSGLNVGVGYNALHDNSTGTLNTAVGGNALRSNSTGFLNTGIGMNALQSNTTGLSNTAVGANALQANVNGESNVGVGFDALYSNTTGSDNVAIGANSLNNNITGYNNIAIGSAALFTNISGTQNVAIGTDALYSNSVGFLNVGIGSGALQFNTIGAGNTGVGANALHNNTTGQTNTAYGFNALWANTTGKSNTAIGANTGNNVTSGSNNVLIGRAVGLSTTTGNNNIYIDGSGLSPANENNTIRIGNTHLSCYIQGIFGAPLVSGVPIFIDSVGKLGTFVSSKEFKHSIAPIGDYSSKVLDLTPVTFVYNNDQDNNNQLGLIAEDVAELFPELVILNEDSKAIGIRYDLLSVLLLNELKKVNVEIKKIKSRIR